MQLPAQLKFNLTVEEIHATADKIIEKTKGEREKRSMCFLFFLNFLFFFFFVVQPFTIKLVKLI